MFKAEPRNYAEFSRNGTTLEINYTDRIVCFVNTFNRSQIYEAYGNVFGGVGSFQQGLTEALRWINR